MTDKAATWKVADLLRELGHYPVDAEVSSVKIVVRTGSRTSTMTYSARDHARRLAAQDVASQEQ